MVNNAFLCLFLLEHYRLRPIAPYDDGVMLLDVIETSFSNAGNIVANLPASTKEWRVYIPPGGIIHPGKLHDAINNIRDCLVQHRDEEPVDVDELVEAVLPATAVQQRVVQIIVTDAETIEGLDMLGTPYPRAMRERRDTVKTINVKLPSPAAALEDPRKVLEDIVGLHPGRPYGNHGPSTALLDRSLGCLAYHLANLDSGLPELQPMPRECQLVRDFAVGSLATHSMKDEDSYAEAINPFLYKFIGRKSTAKGTCMPGGIIGEEALPLGILEYNKIFGDKGDASLQGFVVHTKVVTDPGLERQLARSNLPMVILSVMGNFVEISGTLFTDGAYMTTFFSERIDLSVDADRAVLRLTRAFKAFRICIDALDQSRLAPPAQVPAHLFPSPLLEPTGDTGHKDILSSLRFTDRMRRDGSTFVLACTSHDRLSRCPRSPAKGTLKSPFKSSSSFRDGTTRKRTACSPSPALRPRCIACIPVCDRGGSTKMVVMEHVHGRSAFVAGRDSPGTLLPHAVYEDVEKAIELLQTEEIVFGDLRTPNIMVVDSPAGTHGMLVDFDWAGKHDQDRYPIMLNDSIMSQLAEDIRAYGLMKKQHDDEALKKLKTLCAPA
ncbi:hypothetical protein C8Q80DRAFT_1341954 [Daedaleopsis nitida]|nr:hypothetical protein C8Q80DRAFT_1341954 [Daedaleopsis nitida]